jgi:hypothetical protein
MNEQVIWKAAFKEAQDIRDRLPLPALTDENRVGWLEACDAIRTQWYAADRTRDKAFQAMANALPITLTRRTWMVRELIAREDWQRQFRAARFWIEAHSRWYPIIETLMIDPDTGEQHSIMAEMFADAVAEAERRNATWAAYRAKKASAA